MQDASQFVVDGQCCLNAVGSAKVAKIIKDIVAKKLCSTVTHLDLSGNKLKCVNLNWHVHKVYT